MIVLEQGGIGSIRRRYPTYSVYSVMRLVPFGHYEMVCHEVDL